MITFVEPAWVFVNIIVECGVAALGKLRFYLRIPKTRQLRYLCFTLMWLQGICNAMFRQSYFALVCLSLVAVADVMHMYLPTQPCVSYLQERSSISCKTKDIFPSESIALCSGQPQIINYHSANTDTFSNLLQLFTCSLGS